jgi:hypothetical protein
MLPTAQPKPKPKLLEKRASDAAWQARDKAESQKVKQRSRGQCEVTGLLGGRCPKRASEVHHHIGGWKRRGRGASALAEHKTHCCADHHRMITGHVLQHVSGNRYRSVE